MSWYRNFSDIWYFIDAMVVEFLRYLIFSRCHGIEISQISDIFSMFRCLKFPDIWYFLDVQISELPRFWYFLDVIVSKFLRYLIFSRCSDIRITQISDIFRCHGSWFLRYLEILSMFRCLNFLWYLEFYRCSGSWSSQISGNFIDVQMSKFSLDVMVSNFSDIWNFINVKMLSQI
jgi:hypothetical protein